MMKPCLFCNFFFFLFYIYNFLYVSNFVYYLLFTVKRKTPNQLIFLRKIELIGEKSSDGAGIFLKMRQVMANDGKEIKENMRVFQNYIRVVESLKEGHSFLLCPNDFKVIYVVGTRKREKTQNFI